MNNKHGFNTLLLVLIFIYAISVKSLFLLTKTESIKNSVVFSAHDVSIEVHEIIE